MTRVLLHCRRLYCKLFRPNLLTLRIVVNKISRLLSLYAFALERILYCIQYLVTTPIELFQCYQLYLVCKHFPNIGIAIRLLRPYLPTRLLRRIHQFGYSAH
jgi:hypothetical protein